MGDQGHIEIKHKKFMNGDEYVGGWAGGCPEGQGKYIWMDGSFYEGGWKQGSKHGTGKYTWPSAATYTGEWADGCMHGVGTFEAPDSSKYQGGWHKDLKHGLGKKIYANGDVYEGLWKFGKPEGPGRYVWADGNEYDGEWRQGRMHGQGTFVWKTGERYDGEWRDGQEDGMGMFTFRDGGTYDGLWSAGKKSGVGMYRAPPTERRLVGMSSQELEIISTQSAALDNPVSADGPITSPSIRNRLPPATDGLTEASRVGGSEMVFVRRYERGKLLREEPVVAAELENIFGIKQLLDARKIWRPLKGAHNKQVKRMGEIIFKGHRSFDLMANLQLGIRYTVGKVTSGKQHELTEDDFNLQVHQYFPRTGSTMTPVHSSNDFKWKDYCPTVFRKLRDVFYVDAADYMLSLCGDQALRQLQTPGKSGAIFFLSHDEKYFVKTVRKSEVKLLYESLPKYYAHVASNPHTLLTKFYGLHRIKPLHGNKVRFVVMGNMFQTDLQIHTRYDLKGSTIGRTTRKDKQAEPSGTLKDLDLTFQFKLEEPWHGRLIEQIGADCRLLESCHVMDYSLLIGVHFRSRNMLEPAQNFDEFSGEEDMQRELARAEERISRLRGSQYSEQMVADLVEFARMKMVDGRATKRNMRSPTMVAGIRPKRTPTMRPEAGAEGGGDHLALVMGQTRMQLGVNMAATAIPMDSNCVPIKGGTPEDVILNFGIIDFLQEYNTRKWFEHSFKAMATDGKQISVVEPRWYSMRFQDFMAKVFA